MTNTFQTLADRLTAGRISLAEALRLGTMIADQLEELHEMGITHGAVSPGSIAIAGNAVQLLAATRDEAEATPYAAPEVLAGQPADARSDIFSFGAVIFEMVTGRRACEGESQSPCATGSPAIDRLVNGCLAKSPEDRYQRLQKAMLELKFFKSAARPAVAAAAFVPPAPPAADVQAVHELEERMTARMQEHEKSVATVTEVANEVLKALRQQQSDTPALHHLSRSAVSGPLDDSTAARLEHALNMFGDRLGRMDMVLGSAVDRLQKLEHNLNSFDVDAAALRDSVTHDVRNFERALKAQSTAIESARTAMGQTDDLVERVVEALDSLQSMVVYTPEARLLAS
jgi:hypothetical protein